MNLAPEQDDMRRNKYEMLQALGGPALVNGKTLKCPFHEDSHPSASIRQYQGVWKFHCFVCKIEGDVFDVRAKMEGRSVADVLKETRPQEAKQQSAPILYPSLDALEATYSNVEAIYKYTNPDTNAVELAVIRYNPTGHRKQFAQCSPTGDKWVKTRPAGKLPIYNRTRVREAETILVVEGEKAVHALAKVGIVATTSPMGAGKAGEADWSPLQGKTVYLWPDNDPVDAKTGRSTGEEHMQDVRKILEPMDVHLYWIDPSGLGLPAKGDVVDFIALNQGSSEDNYIAVQLAMQEAQPLGADKELGSRLELIMSGEWVNLEWPWPMITNEAQSLLPDTVTALCGDPGSGKSYFILEAWWKWNLGGVRTAIFELEDDRVYHMQRVLAQLEQNSMLTDVGWIHGNPEKTREHWANQSDVIKTLGKVMWDAPDKQVSTSDLASWFETRCQEGFKLCIIDPITAATASEKPWIDDQAFIFKVKTTAKKYHSRLIFAIHPRISHGKVGASLNRLAGGAAYPRFSHSAFWLTRHEVPETSKVRGVPEGTRLVSYERTLKISKARNGRGAGMALAYHLDVSSLCFVEYGEITPETSDTKIRNET